MATLTLVGGSVPRLGQPPAPGTGEPAGALSSEVVPTTAPGLQRHGNSTPGAVLASPGRAAESEVDPQLGTGAKSDGLRLHGAQCESSAVRLDETRCGVVQDAFGASIGGARVYVRAALGRETVSNFRSGAEHVHEVHLDADPSGRFSFRADSRLSYVGVARAPGGELSSPALLRPPPRVSVLTCEAACQVTILVTDASRGFPIDAATCLVRRPTSGAPALPSFEWSAETGEAGELQLHLGAGLWLIAIRHPRYQPGAASVIAKSGGTSRHSVSLAPLEFARLQVVGPSGRGVAGARVVLSGESESFAASDLGWLEVSLRGGLDRTWVTVFADGYVARRGTLEKLLLEEGGQQIRIEPATELVVLVLDEAGQAVSGALLTARQSIGGAFPTLHAESSALSDEQGKARFTDLDARLPVRVTVLDGERIATTELSRWSAGDQLRLSVRRGRRLVVSVLAEDGESVSGATVRAWEAVDGDDVHVQRQAKAAARVRVSDDDGRVTFQPLPSGRWRVEARLPDGVTAACELVLPDQPEELHTTIRMPRPTVLVSGQILPFDPESQYSVWFAPYGARAVVAGDGRFEFRAIPAGIRNGTVYCEVRRPGGDVRGPITTDVEIPDSNVVINVK